MIEVTMARTDPAEYGGLPGSEQRLPNRAPMARSAAQIAQDVRTAAFREVAGLPPDGRPRQTGLRVD